MSFDWNPSDDEEVDISSWANAVTQPTTTQPSAVARLDSFAPEQDDSEDDIEWEDAEAATEEAVPATEESDSKPAAQPKKRRRRRYRTDSLPAVVQDRIQQLHRTHLLCLTSRVTLVSRICSDPLVLAAALSLVPDPADHSRRSLDDACRWIMDRIHATPRRRRAQGASNRSAGAPRRKGKAAKEDVMLVEKSEEITTIDRLLSYLDYLSPRYDSDPQLFDAPTSWTTQDQLQVCLALLRSQGWHTRYVEAVDPIRIDSLNEDHPFWIYCRNGLATGSSSKNTAGAETPDIHCASSTLGIWLEVRCEGRWIPVDPIRRTVDELERAIYPYVVGSDERSIVDITPRCSSSWLESLRRRGLVRGKKVASPSEIRATWWAQTLVRLNGGSRASAIDLDAGVEEAALKDEAIPTSKTAFQSHPLYAIPSVLNNAEVIDPTAKFCGVFKGELVYRRNDISTALPEKKWLYLGRRVREGEKPVKTVKARKKPQKRTFQALSSYGVGGTNDGSEGFTATQKDRALEPLEDGMQRLYGRWQTEPWSPDPVGPEDPIPVNEFKNIELELLNPGLVHIDSRGMANVAKKLGVPYAPCLLGFEGHGGNRTPVVRGIVVHAHNEQLMREAATELESFHIESEHQKRRLDILTRWKKLMVGVLTKDRIEREYGDKAE